MVNVLVKSTKVPRPVAMAPLPNRREFLERAKERAKQAGRNLAPRTNSEEAEEEEEQHVPSHFSYAGNESLPITSELKVVMPGDDVPSGIWPVFRMMDESGNFRQTDKARHTNAPKFLPPKGDLSELKAALTFQHPHFAEQFEASGLLRPAGRDYPDTKSDNTLLRAQRQMIRLRKMDNILHNAQRQGRISFYMTHHGEEAIHMGSASALEPQDHVFAQYREAGVLMWRGFTLGQFCDQCFSNDRDLGRGKQMPVHYGSRALNYHTVSSPLGTQITHAVGAAYKFKLDALNHPEKERAISIVYFGDGAASTIDFHSACNFAATLKAPMIFFCRNNGYAISTPVEDQYAGDGIVSRAPGYGMAGIRVDGNDLFAVHSAVAKARKLALETSSPVMIEAMTYRQGHHSTSDDSLRYRDADEVQNAADVSDPMLRLDRFLRRMGWTDEDEVVSIEDEERIAVLSAMEEAEKRPKPGLDMMFRDVYHEKPPHLVRQEEDLKRHMKRHNIARS
jgi:2-oxoisovalerate dehydrogenase E1 component alpha subunit